MISVGELLLRNGVNVIFDATAGYRRFREEARQRLEKFMEVYVKCPLEVAEQRDPKQIYKKARQGVFTDVPGVQAPYEPPLEPEVVVDATSDDLDAEVKAVMSALQTKGFLPNK
jgi:adenylylsulfate kinase